MFINKTYKYATVIFLIWSIAISWLLFWDHRHTKADTRRTIKNEAKAYFNKDQALRLWATAHGGVYVPPDGRTPPNPYLSHIPDRDITSSSGKKLTLMNPAYILRQVMEEYSELYGVRGHITSRKPLRPQNIPDEWELSALLSFEKGEKEAWAFTEIDGIPYYRFMSPMVTKKGCLKCHAIQGYKEGELRGGVSVSIPMTGILQLQKQRFRTHLLTYLIIWFLGIFGIVTFSYRIKENRIKRLHTEKVLRESEKKYQDLYDNAPDMFVSVDAGTAKVIQCNQTLATRLGFDKTQIIGQPIFSLYHPDCMEEVKEAFQQFVETGTVDNAELFLRRKDGTKIHVALNVTAQRDDQGDILYSRSIWRDITELKKAQNEVKEYHQSLEKKVSERTSELENEIQERQKVEAALQEKIKEITRFSRLAMDREKKMIQLKKEINSLLHQLGRKEEYTIVE